MPEAGSRIAIAGAGPIGLTAALTLARHGVPSVVLEEDDGVCSGSRAIGMSRRTLEIWSALGAADEIAAHGLGWGSGRSFYRGRTVLRFEMPDDPAIRFRPMFNIAQSDTERFLAEAAARTGLVEIRWGTRVVSVKAQADGVEVGTGHGTSRHPWLLACDGAKSAVRASLGLHLEGTSYEASYVIADIRLDTDAPIERRCWFDPPSNPGSTVLMHRQPGGIWRLDYQLRPGEDPELATEPAQVRQRIRAHLEFIGERGAWELVWASIYRVHSRGLRSFRHGRVLFAGDAAHLMPIFGIRGLNSGVEDAWNLGWKLAFVHQGQAQEPLLDSYSSERRAVFLENIALADRNAWFMTPPSPGARLLRDAVLELALTRPEVQDIINPRQASYVPLRASPLSVADAQPFDGGPAPGEVVPDAALPSSGFLHSRLDPTRFNGLFFSDQAPAGWDALAAELPLHRVVVPPELHARFGAAPGAFYLVRPDHHVLGRWTSFDAEAARAALARVLGAQPLAVTSSPPPPELGKAERVYRQIGAALGDVEPGAHPLFLAKLALLLGLALDDPELLPGALEHLR